MVEMKTLRLPPCTFGTTLWMLTVISCYFHSRNYEGEADTTFTQRFPSLAKTAGFIGALLWVSTRVS